MRNVDKYLWGAGFFILPFIFSYAPISEQMRIPKEHFLVLLAGFYLAFQLCRKVSFSLGCGTAVVFFSAFFVTGVFPDGALLTLFAALSSCLFVAKLGENDIERGLEILELSALCCAAYAMILQLGRADPFLTLIEGADYRRVMVFFGQHTLYGPFCVAALASSLFRGRFYRSILLATPICFIDASFTYLSAFVVVALFLVRRFGLVAFFSIAILVLVSSVAFLVTLDSHNSVKTEALNDNGRFPLWKISYRIARARPLMGHGLGSFRYQFPAFQKKEIREANGIDDTTLSPEAKQVVKEADELRLRSGIFIHPHNEILLSFYELGIAGPILCFMLICSFLIAWIQLSGSSVDWALLAIFLSFCANSMGNFGFHLVPQALLPLWAYVAVTSRARRGNL